MRDRVRVSGLGGASDSPGGACAYACGIRNVKRSTAVESIIFSFDFQTPSLFSFIHVTRQATTYKADRMYTTPAAARRLNLVRHFKNTLTRHVQLAEEQVPRYPYPKIV